MGLAQPIAPPLEHAELSDTELDELRELILKTFGVSISDNKRAMVRSRLWPVLSREGLPTFRAYIDRVKADRSRALLSELVNRISTNHTFFYRESAHFDFFAQKAVPEAIRRRKAESKKRLRVWCAASSTGQEPYTLAIILANVMGVAQTDWDTGVLATDINTDVLDFAKRGVYEASDVEKLPPLMLSRGFTKLPDGRYEARDFLKKAVLYRRLNLMTAVFPFKSKFDAVFCRNVMIYFDPPTTAALCKRIADKMEPGSYLFIGAGESVPTSVSALQSVAPSIYQRR